MVTPLNWWWIAFAATVPGLVAVLAALPFWRRSQPIFGGIVGTVVVFGTATGLILREYVEIDQMVKACLDAGTVCWPEPSAFTRFAIYAFIALFEVCGLFWLGLVVDEKVRRRDYAPEWR